MKSAVLYYIVVYQIQFLKNDCHLGDDPPHEEKRQLNWHLFTTLSKAAALDSHRVTRMDSFADSSPSCFSSWCSSRSANSNSWRCRCGVFVSSLERRKSGCARLKPWSTCDNSQKSNHLPVMVIFHGEKKTNRGFKPTGPVARGSSVDIDWNIYIMYIYGLGPTGSASLHAMAMVR